MDLMEMQMLQKLDEMKIEIARMEEQLEAQQRPAHYKQGKVYVALSLIGRPFILFGRADSYAFYGGVGSNPVSFSLDTLSASPQGAIDAVWARDGGVYTFDTIREAMTFFLEHLKEEE